MPTIYDNIEQNLADALKNAFNIAYKADICVGYFNLRGWDALANYVDKFDGEEDAQCRLIVGMHTQTESLIRRHYNKTSSQLDTQTAKRLQTQLAEEFRTQLTLGIPTTQDQKTLNKLLEQLKSEKLKVRLFLNYPLHAKLYLIHRKDDYTPVLGYLGSSNLTFSGLGNQGELNIDVLDKEATDKLCDWFEDRWNERFCIDISQQLIEILEQAWVIPKSPYYIYLKIAYHLSKEARLGINEFKLPPRFEKDLLNFQQNAVKIAAQHLNKRGGVLLGDVVGLGKTITATALAKLFEDDYGLETLILCPKNLTEMWEDYIHRYQLHAKVLSQSKVKKELPTLRRYRLIIIDESHNLRNREGKTYKIIEAYIKRNNSKVILLSATPYNKAYQDLSAQLGLFIEDNQDLGISPECYLNEIGGIEQFIAEHQKSPYTLAAFEESDFTDDWRELMRLYLVRRTRGFVKQNSASFDEIKQRYYLTLPNKKRVYFPDRIAKKVEYHFDETDINDPYAKLYSERVVSIINSLKLPRYGLLKYLDPHTELQATQNEDVIISNLTRAGERLKGFASTNLFKRLESSGYAFLLSVYRHVMRNYVFIYAINEGLEIPIGQQESHLLDSFLSDDDLEQLNGEKEFIFHQDTKKYYQDAEKIYNYLHSKKAHKFDWIRSGLFSESLKHRLTEDSIKLNQILKLVPRWIAKKDRKLQALIDLVSIQHSKQKLLIFTQYADTANYLYQQLDYAEIKQLACVTGASKNPTAIAHKFSPISNEKKLAKDEELRVLITTDVLSEGQNLQDAHIIVNYDLPWAIIRLIQRAGRVDRIGQQADNIYCYSFLPEEGIEKIINLRNRLMQRIEQNADVVGSDEKFFEGDAINLHDLYNEKSGILDDKEDEEVDLASYAYQIWKNATDANPNLKQIIPKLPDVVYSTKAVQDSQTQGVIVYAKTSSNNDILLQLNAQGEVISQSQFNILHTAACNIKTESITEINNHHLLVEQAISYIHSGHIKIGGQLGNKSSARYQIYHRLEHYYQLNKNSLFENQDLKKIVDDIYNNPLSQEATNIILRQIKLKADDESLAQLAISLQEEGKLCLVTPQNQDKAEMQIVCSLGLA